MISGYSSKAKRSKRLELAVAKELGARRQPASGALRDAKDDIIWDDVRIEQKFTDGDSYRLTENVFGATYNRAKQRGQTGLVLVIFPKTNTKLVVLERKQAASFFGTELLTREGGVEQPPKTLAVLPTSDGHYAFGEYRVYITKLDNLISAKRKIDEQCKNNV